MTVQSPDRLVGRMGFAAKIQVPADNLEHQATLAAWFLHLPGQHIAWDDYQIAVVHLRPLAGVLPAQLRYDAAEYEIDMFALDPSRQPRFDLLGTLMPLLPLNYSVQFHGVGDHEVITACRQMAQHFVEGHLIAEPQGVRGARELFFDLLERALGKQATLHRGEDLG